METVFSSRTTYPTFLWITTREILFIAGDQKS